MQVLVVVVGTRVPAAVAARAVRVGKTALVVMVVMVPMPALQHPVALAVTRGMLVTAAAALCISRREPSPSHSPRL